MAPADLLEIYGDALDADRCNALIAGFEKSGQAARGMTGSGVDVSAKDRWDIQLETHPDWADAQRMLNRVVMEGFKRDLRRYAHVALAPLQLKRKDAASGNLVAMTDVDVDALDDASLGALVTRMFRPGSINLQKYLADRGGCPYWHCERYPHPHADDGESLHRVVLWTIYLNDTFAAGETEFLYQERRIVPRTGSLLIAPAAITHAHRGNMPRGGDKFIATSWILFDRAATLYAPPTRTP